MRYQGSCLVNEEGWKNMVDYDWLPVEARLLLQNSSENLCPACLPQFLTSYSPAGFRQAVEKMERAVRAKREANKPAF